MTETKTDAKTETTEAKPTRMSRESYAWRLLRNLASQPAGAMSRLPLFLDGPLSLDELAEKILREQTLDADEEAECLRSGWPVRAALATLNRAGVALEYREGKFHLAEEHRAAVELYAAIAGHAAHVERGKYTAVLGEIAVKVGHAGLDDLAEEILEADCRRIMDGWTGR